MDHQARPRLTSLHIGNAHFYLAKEMNFRSEHRIGSSFAPSFSCYQGVLSISYGQIPVIILNGACGVKPGSRAVFLNLLKIPERLASVEWWTVCPWAQLQCWKLLQQHSGSRGHQGRGPGYSLWCCLCSDLQPLVGWKGHPFSAHVSWAPWSYKLSPAPPLPGSLTSTP